MDESVKQVLLASLRQEYDEGVADLRNIESRAQNLLALSGLLVTILYTLLGDARASLEAGPWPLVVSFLIFASVGIIAAASAVCLRLRGFPGGPDTASLLSKALLLNAGQTTSTDWTNLLLTYAQQWSPILKALHGINATKRVPLAIAQIALLCAVSLSAVFFVGAALVVARGDDRCGPVSSHTVQERSLSGQPVLPVSRRLEAPPRALQGEQEEGKECGEEKSQAQVEDTIVGHEQE